jgi:hypothetical protein
MTTDLKTRDSAPEKALRLKFSGYQMFVVALLAFLQFSIVLGFMVISPLGRSPCRSSISAAAIW